MAYAHGLFIPEQEYLTDLEGLITYLGEKIGVGNTCIYCGRSFQTAEGTRAHMIDKGHCKMSYSTQSEILEYSDYYDFTSSYNNHDYEDLEVVDDDNDSAWSDADDDSSVASEDIHSVQLSPHDLLELRLPHSGKRLGHRSLARYYKQKLRPTRPISQGEQTHRLLIEAPGSRALMHGKQPMGVRKFGERSMHVETSKRRHAEREAKKFRDQREREQFRIGIAFRKTAEFKKYYRGKLEIGSAADLDPLLQ
jgi:pre-60S factor REI1